MTTSRTLAQLRTDARETADMVNQTLFITDTELTRRINESIARLYGILVQARGEDYYRTSSAVVTVANVRTVALPTTFLSLSGIDIVLSTNVTIDARPIDFGDRARFFNDTSGWWSFQSVYYSIEGPNLVFYPTPRAVHNLTIWYIPHAPTLTADSDTFDGINRWEHWVVIDTAIQLLAKEESDTTALVFERERMEREITSMATKRDRAFPRNPRDVRGRWRRRFGSREEWWNP